MKKTFLVVNNRRLNFISKYNLRLYKKCLSFKNFFSNNDQKQTNLIFSKESKVPIIFLKKIYARQEKIPLRLFRYFSLLDYSRLISYGVKYLVSKKLSVYSGRHLKFINLNQGLLEVTLKCSYKFGDLIFTRARYKFKKKKKKKNKKIYGTFN